ncbi:uncharacterized protein BP5553_01034 [Venustampulla echinocandica]|uniref:Uncharacterized protein n=1 Tax=Venustampulla echinocandica TaxID=2656787 RepID=A0A370TZW0_9HELO|nr:uncharacterized protein BP5553_01034 [Venustampulla echinocandica]RDL41055.1 hypothetical protein BP5553_01034 [Venustampulla echinocandica]
MHPAKHAESVPDAASSDPQGPKAAGTRHGGETPSRGAKPVSALRRISISAGGGSGLMGISEMISRLGISSAGSVTLFPHPPACLRAFCQSTTLRTYDYCTYEDCDDSVAGRADEIVSRVPVVHLRSSRTDTPEFFVLWYAISYPPNNPDSCLEALTPGGKGAGNLSQICRSSAKDVCPHRYPGEGTLSDHLRAVDNPI